ncbi:MAG: thioredoxin-dependent thiol peroxidase [Sarcina sp.]
MLEVGVKAPNFNLEDKDGNMISLDQFKGKKVVLYFYPKDSTPGCTKQACGFRDSFEDFKGKDVVVIGVSKDSVKSHQRFAEKNELPFILLSDPELEAIQGYDVWKLKKMAGREYMGVVRTTYIIDENGMIEKVYEKVKTDKNAAEILEYLG